MSNGYIALSQKILADIKPLLFFLLFFLILLFGSWISYRFMIKYIKKFGENQIFYLDDDVLIINKLKHESFFQTFLPNMIKFPLSSIDYIEIGYGSFKRAGYMPYVQIIKKNRGKSIKYWFSSNSYIKRKFFEEPVRDTYLVMEAMKKIAKELEALHISFKINDVETVKIFL